MLKRSFTLIELVVVLVIMMLVTGIAVTAMRSETPAEIMERNVLEFDAFIARVRYRCAESGRDYVVRYYPDKNLLCAHIDYSDEELENMEHDVTEAKGSFTFSFARELEFFTVESAEKESSEDEFVELFRFFPSGGGVRINRPGIRVEEKAKHFDISFFSGQLIVKDGEGEIEEEKK